MSTECVAEVRTDNAGLGSKVSGEASPRVLAEMFGHLGVTMWTAIRDMHKGGDEECPSLDAFYDFAKAWAKWYFENRPENEGEIQ